MLSVLGPYTMKFNRFLLTSTQTRVKNVCYFVSNAKNTSDPSYESVLVADFVHKQLISRMAAFPI